MRIRCKFLKATKRRNTKNDLVVGALKGKIRRKKIKEYEQQRSSGGEGAGTRAGTWLFDHLIKLSSDP